MLFDFVRFCINGGLREFRNAVNKARQTGSAVLQLEIKLLKTDDDAVVCGPIAKEGEEPEVQYDLFEIDPEEKV